jgi:hypothetical protein
MRFSLWQDVCNDKHSSRYHLVEVDDSLRQLLDLMWHEELQTKCPLQAHREPEENARVATNHMGFLQYNQPVQHRHS